MKRKITILTILAIFSIHFVMIKLAFAEIRITDLGTLGGSNSYAYDINNQGQIVGESEVNSGESHACLWTRVGGITDLGNLGGSWAFASEINDQGQVVGDGETSSGKRHSFFWTEEGGMIDLGSLIGGDYVSANDLNNLGQVIGWEHYSYDRVAFIWSEGVGIVDLGNLGIVLSSANSINNNGEVVGWSRVNPYDSHAFLWTSETGMIDLGMLDGGISSSAHDNNDQGQVVGHSETASGHRHAFLWSSEGGMVDLGTLGGSWSRAWYINSQGKVIGESETATGGAHGFLWTLDEGMIDIGTLGGTWSEVYGINDLGHVTGHSEIATGETHAFLWTPEEGMIDLGTLGGANSYSWGGINNHGQIVGESQTGAGEWHAVLWEIVEDNDSDGVCDIDEQGPSGTDTIYDGNGDGTPDAQQNNVASLYTYDNTNYVTLASPDGTSLQDVQAKDNPSPGDAPEGVDFLYGFFGFIVQGVDVGGSTTVTLYLPEEPDTYWKYGPTPDNPSDHWYEFLFDGMTGAEVIGNIVILHFVDGQRGDDDCTANGTIVDQGSPGYYFIEASIDIKPGSEPNCFNNDCHGVIPVAILGAVDFNVSNIDPGTINLQGLSVKVVGKSNKYLAHYEDVNNDDYNDLVVQIEDTDKVFSEGSTIAEIEGFLYDGTTFKGADSICIVP